jgi:uncharacterized membrane protein
MKGGTVKGNAGRVLEYLRHLDVLSKVALVVLVSVLTYVVLLALLKPFFITQGITMGQATIMGDHMMSFQNPEEANLNIAAIVGAVIAGAATAFGIGQREQPVAQKTEQLDELTIIKRVLSPDEKKLIGVIEEAGEITQDSLTFRLEWSRAKVSVMVTNLERLNILQRKREGKTYVVFLPKSHGKR